MLTTNPYEDDRFREECGVFGVWGHSDSAALVALGLHALQHRGQEAAGIVAYDGEQFRAHRGMGNVAEIFGSKEVIAGLPGDAALGHVRYATTGEVALRNVQPLFADIELGGFAICHNGNLTNAYHLRRQLVRRGSLFQSTSDTEVIVHLVATSLKGTVVERLVDALRQVEGAYSLGALSQAALIGVRDPLGVRPLVLGRLGDAWIISSETCALDIIGADFVRDVEPGEIIVIDDEGLRSIKPFGRHGHRFCVFEHIYFARPDSIVEGSSVYEARKRIGMELARESHVPADLVVPVPDSGVPAAIGYAAESGIPFELGIIRNHYVGRTFIEPTDQIRHLGVKLKHNANRANLAGKRVILVDDSIVRGTTSTKIVEMVRSAGASEVHMRISSPPTTHSCFYGIATPTREQLLASRYDVAMP
jgi:amidophosphoribosyltransferase